MVDEHVLSYFDKGNKINMELKVLKDSLQSVKISGVKGMNGEGDGV